MNSFMAKVVNTHKLRFHNLSSDQQRLFNQGSIHDAHDQTQAEVIQQPGPNVEVMISDPMNMANQYSIGMLLQLYTDS